MSSPVDPRVLFAAERTLLAWQRSSLALMGLGFVIERFSLFVAVLRQAEPHPRHQVFALLVGVAFILLGAGVALVSSWGYRRYLKTLPTGSVESGFLVSLGALINVAIAVCGVTLALYMLATEL